MPWMEFEDVAPPKAKTRPSNEALEAATDKIYEAGKFHSWFKGPLDWRALDPIGKDEFLSIVEKALTAASAIDGDERFNEGISACQEYLRSVHHSGIASSLEKLKKVTP